MNEKDLLNKIKSDADTIVPPASLSPDAIEQMLKKQQNTRVKNKVSARRSFLRYGSLAAMFVLVFAGAWYVNNLSRHSVKISAEKVSDETGNTVTENSSDLLMPSYSSREPDTDTLSYAQTYEEIYSALMDITFFDEYEELIEFGTVEARTLYSSGSVDGGIPEGAVEKGVAADIAVEEMAAADLFAEDSIDMGTGNTITTAGTGEKDFSDTNLQEQGVDEADIIKTDGTYIYILRRDGTLAIVKADGASSETVSITKISDLAYATMQEMYLDGNMLHVIAGAETTVLQNDTADTDIFYTSTNQQTIIYTWDITDRSAPVHAGTVTQEGNYADSRKVGSYLYLFTRYYPDVQETYEASMIIPRINGKTAAADDFYLPKELQNTTYLVISSVDTKNPSEVLDSKILVSGATNFYVSTENIYIANESYGGRNTDTTITKFHYENGSITGVAAGSVKGYLNDSFSMNEHKGYLRTVTTYFGNSTTALREAAGDLINYDLSVTEDWEEHNGLFIFDENMQQISSIEDLASGETIRSARFLGNTGYFVTFRQTDPLFSVDLSDPASPRILGELKISGFSSYLHPYGDDLLLGIGYEADETTGITTGVKLSMFDVSDPGNVTEIHRLILPDMTWCPAIENYKSILVNPAKNLIGFYCDNRYLTFSWDKENGFSQELVYDFYSDMLTGEAEYDTVRGLYIEDMLYVAGETFVVSFDMDQDFAKTGIHIF